MGGPSHISLSVMQPFHLKVHVTSIPWSFFFQRENKYLIIDYLGHDAIENTFGIMATKFSIF